MLYSCIQIVYDTLSNKWLMYVRDEPEERQFQEPHISGCINNAWVWCPTEDKNIWKKKLFAHVKEAMEMNIENLKHSLQSLAAYEK